MEEQPYEQSMEGATLKRVKHGIGRERGLGFRDGLDESKMKHGEYTEEELQAKASTDPKAKAKGDDANNDDEDTGIGPRGEGALFVKWQYEGGFAYGQRYGRGRLLNMYYQFDGDLYDALEPEARVSVRGRLCAYMRV